MASAADDIIDRRARDFVATELEAASDKAYLEAHKAAQRASAAADESTAAMFRVQAADYQARGHYYAGAAAHVRGLRTSSPMEACMAGIAAVGEAAEPAQPVRGTKPRAKRSAA